MKKKYDLENGYELVITGTGWKTDLKTAGTILDCVGSNCNYKIYIQKKQKG